MQPLISILTLYKANNDLFNKLNLPTQLEEKKDAIVFEILAECGELNACYPNPLFLQNNIGMWSELNLPSWQRMCDALTVNYEVLTNYKRIEKAKEISEGTGKTTTNTDSTSNSEDLSKIYKNAYNTSEQVQAGTNESNASVKNDISVTQNDSKNDTKNVEREISGLSGTESPQSLVEKEYALAQKNVAEFIIREFKNKFCIVVY